MPILILPAPTGKSGCRRAGPSGPSRRIVGFAMRVLQAQAAVVRQGADAASGTIRDPLALRASAARGGAGEPVFVAYRVASNAVQGNISTILQVNVTGT